MDPGHRWFAGSALALLGTLVWAAIDEQRQEWKPVQEAYRGLATERAPDLRSRDAAEQMAIELRQDYLPDLHRIDRCRTCHLGVDDPRMADAPEPFRAHPGLHLERHPPERFGCTVCHQGQGHATNAREAHGHVPHWEKPMLRKDLMDAACGRCHQAETVEGAPLLSHGRQLQGELGCRGCHVIRGRGGHIGPPLTGVASRDVNGDGRRDAADWDWHFRHFKDPRSVSPGSLMPQFGLDDRDVRALATLVLSLTDENIHNEYLVPERPPDVRMVPGAAERGRRTWRQAGCAGCHGREGRGGIANPNAQGGAVPPLQKYAGTLVATRKAADRLIALVDEAHRTGSEIAGIDADWLKPFRDVRRLILEGRTPAAEDPTRPPPPLRMPAWGEQFSRGEADDVIAYVVSLQPAAEWEEEWDE